MKNDQIPTPSERPNHDRAISLRIPDDTLHALSRYIKELAKRDQQPYTRSAVLLSLLESQLHQQKKLKRTPILKPPTKRRRSRKKSAKKTISQQQPITQPATRENTLRTN
jgi:hypothetical protein